MRCRACAHAVLEQFLDLGRMPLAGGFLDSEAAIAHEDLYPLAVHVCVSCGLVQIVDPVDPAVLFQNYSFASSTVKPLIDHFEQYAKWLVDRYSPALVVEFGCNDGILLAPLGDLGVRAIGVDVSENITKMGRERGLDIVTGSFDRELASAILKENGPADVVTGSNAFAHNSRPEEILEAAALLLGDGGHLCLEVMYAGDLYEQVQWDTLYHEHLTFYSLGTLSVLLERFGFSVMHAERIPMHGGSLRVVAARRRGGEPSSAVREIREFEDGLELNRPQTWTDFGRHVRRKIDIVATTLSALSQSSRIWGYGAAGKATMWVNACGLTYLEKMVDASPLRAGKLMPGTHTPIVFPDELRANPPDYIFVTAWNYADVIRSNESWFEGTWVTPLPDMRFF